MAAGKSGKSPSTRGNLGQIKLHLNKRYEEVSEQLRSGKSSDFITDKFEKRLNEVLNRYGINYPRTFDYPPPDVYVPARQGTIYLQPAGSVGVSPPEATDVACLSFKAKDSGFLVIDKLDFIMEDPIAESCVTIEYKFENQKNSAQHQCDNGTSEPGHWKFNRIILVDGQCLRVCLRNICDDAAALVSWESRMWSL